MNSIQTINHDEMIPMKFHLSQNYPNPFTEKTNIKYCVAFKTKVKIIICDSVGKLIEKLLDEEILAGTYELTWNAADLPSGVYFYQLQAGNYVDIKKMILSK